MQAAAKMFTRRKTEAEVRKIMPSSFCHVCRQPVVSVGPTAGEGRARFVKVDAQTDELRAAMQ